MLFNLSQITNTLTHCKPYSESEHHMDFTLTCTLCGKFYHESPIGQRHIMLQCSVQSCVQWEDETLWTGVSNTNRRCRKVNENLQWTCREAVQYSRGMCHNAWIQQSSSALHPRFISLTLAHSSLSLSVFLLIKFFPFTPPPSPSLPLTCLFHTLFLTKCHPPLALVVSRRCRFWL